MCACMCVCGGVRVQALEEEVQRGRQQYDALMRTSEAQKRDMTAWLQDLQKVSEWPLPYLDPVCLLATHGCG